MLGRPCWAPVATMLRGDAWHLYVQILLGKGPSTARGMQERSSSGIWGPLSLQGAKQVQSGALYTCALCL